MRDESDEASKRLLVGQRELLARLDGGHRGRQTRIAHQGVDHHFGVSASGDLRHGLLSGVNLRVGVRKCFAQGGVMALVGDHNRVGVEFPGLLREFFPVAVRREDAGFEAVGVLADDVERLHADRTGRTQYGKSLFHAFVRRRCEWMVCPTDTSDCERFL